MECSIPGNAVKIFGRMVQCLAKVGEDMIVSVSSEGIFLTTVNMRLTSFYSFHLEPGYFEPFIPSDPMKTVVCKVLIKPVAAIFRSLMNVDRCTIKLTEDDPKLIFEMECKNNSRRIYRFNIEDSELNRAIYQKDSAPLKLAIKPATLIAALSNFQQAQEEIKWTLSPEQIEMATHFSDAKTDVADLKARSPVSVKLEALDFDTYDLGPAAKVELIFSLQDMRPAQIFAEKAGAPVHFTAHYASKKPLVMSVGMVNLFTADFVFSVCGDPKVESTLPSASGSISASQSATPTGLGSSSSAMMGGGYQMPQSSYGNTRYSPAHQSISSISHHQNNYHDAHQFSSPSMSSAPQPHMYPSSGSPGGGAAVEAAVAHPARVGHGTPHPGNIRMPAFSLSGNTQGHASSGEDIIMPAIKRRKIGEDSTEMDVDGEEGDLPDSQE